MNKLNIEIKDGLPVVEIENEDAKIKELEAKLAAIRVISSDDEFGAIEINGWDGRPSMVTKSDYVQRWGDYVSQLTNLAVDNDTYQELNSLIERVEQIAGERFMEMFKKRHPEANNTVINDEIADS
tara:strand:- start:132 stop:509 length:378 start_codon:yes stop_codon:yes gene_type:complete